MYAAYAANPTANAAVSPGSSTNKLIQPKRKAVRGPKLSRRYTYGPPALGKRPASSPKQSAPHSVMAPTASQTMSSQQGEASDLAMPAGVRKMPTAIASPATTAAAEPRPSWRRRSSRDGGVIPVGDDILQRKRTAPCACKILRVYGVRGARCASSARARETFDAPNTLLRRKMISLRAFVTPPQSRDRSYRGGCGTAGDSDGEPAEAWAVLSNRGSCLARAIFATPRNMMAAIATITQSRRTGAGVVRTGMTKPKIIPARRPPRCAALNECPWSQSGSNPRMIKNARRMTMIQRRLIVGDGTRSRQYAAQSAPTRPKATPLAPNP